MVYFYHETHKRRGNFHGKQSQLDTETASRDGFDVTLKLNCYSRSQKGKKRSQLYFTASREGLKKCCLGIKKSYSVTVSGSW